MSRKSLAFVSLVAAAGLSLWLAAGVYSLLNYALREQLIFLALVPLIVVTSMFPNTFPLPSGLKFTKEKVSFTLSDAVVLLVACWYGPAPAVLIAGVEGFATSRRAIRRFSSNVFSFGMMSVVAAASCAVLGGVLRGVFGESGAGAGQSFPAVAVALLAASIVHIIVNTALFSTFFALRQSSPVWQNWKQNVLWALPIFLPTSAVASLLYIALQYDALVTIVIGAPLLCALYFGHRQYRTSVEERIHSMEKAHRQTIEALAVAINAKDEVTHEHVLRVQIYAAGVARILGCTEAEVEALKAGALLHDIGKIAVPDYILNKPGKLTAAEFNQMKLHTVAGAQILSRVEFPYPVVPVVRSHHERWDGKGYPDGLSGEGIPLTARILTVVDCFDAVREDRQYRKGFTREQAITYIMEGSGTFYDPRVVGTFITHLPEFEAEILGRRDAPLPNFGIEPLEQLSEQVLHVQPAAGLADESKTKDVGATEITRDEQQALERLAQEITRAGSTEELLDAFTKELRAVVSSETCAVTLTAPESGDHTVAHASGAHAALLSGRRVKLGEGVVGWVLANRKSFCNTDPKLDLPAALAEDFAAYRTLAVVPLIDGKEIHGALALYSSTLAEYDANQQRLLERAAALLAVAISNNARARTLAQAPAPSVSSELTH